MRRLKGKKMGRTLSEPGPSTILLAPIPSCPQPGLKLVDLLLDLLLALGRFLFPELPSRFLLGYHSGIFCGDDLGLHVGHRTTNNLTAEALHLGVDHLDRRLRNMCYEAVLPGSIALAIVASTLSARSASSMSIRSPKAPPCRPARS